MATVEPKIYRFDEHLEIKGASLGQEGVGDYFLAFDFLDETGGLQHTFRDLDQKLKTVAPAYLTMLKMKGTRDIFFPDTLELHVRRVDSQEMELDIFESIIAGLLLGQKSQRLTVTLRNDKTWCIISPNLNRTD